MTTGTNLRAGPYLPQLKLSGDGGYDECEIASKSTGLRRCLLPVCYHRLRSDRAVVRRSADFSSSLRAQFEFVHLADEIDTKAVVPVFLDHPEAALKV